MKKTFTFRILVVDGVEKLQVVDEHGKGVIVEAAAMFQAMRHPEGLQVEWRDE